MNHTHHPRVTPVDAVALGHVLSHAALVGLPMPDAAHLMGGSVPGVRLDVASILDLTEWSRYLEQPIETEPLTAHIDHHIVDGEILELRVRVICSIAYDPAVRRLSAVQS